MIEGSSMNIDSDSSLNEMMKLREQVEEYTVGTAAADRKVFRQGLRAAVK
jgi:hypothetical protein